MLFVCCCRGSINERQQSKIGQSRVPAHHARDGPERYEACCARPRIGPRQLVEGFVGHSSFQEALSPERCAAYGVLQRV